MLIRTALIVAAVAGGAQARAGTLPAPAAGTRCAASDYRQLDFWIGEWEVFDKVSGQHVGGSRIERAMNGCAVQEHYEAPKTPQGAYAGVSYSGFDGRDRKWHQFYVDTNGNITRFEGALEGPDMVMVADLGGGALRKMTYRPQEDGSVEQIGMSSNDGGRTWLTGYDYLYRHK